MNCMRSVGCAGAYIEAILIISPPHKAIIFVNLSVWEVSCGEEMVRLSVRINIPPVWGALWLNPINRVNRKASASVLNWARFDGCRLCS